MAQLTTIYLHTTVASELRPRHSSDPRFVVREAVVPQWQLNRFLYFLVGEEWEWVDKRSWSDQRWRDYVASEGLRTFVAFLEGNIAGYYELSRDEAGAVEIAYLGLASQFIGRGLGAALLTDALERAWAWGACRVWVHTCTLDHPAALKNYEARGMSVYDRQTEGYSEG
jgi:GNAT superfamily N-acetyltransferase